MCVPSTPKTTHATETEALSHDQMCSNDICGWSTLCNSNRVTRAGVDTVRRSSHHTNSSSTIATPVQSTTREKHEKEHQTTTRTTTRTSLSRRKAISNHSSNCSSHSPISLLMPTCLPQDVSHNEIEADQEPEADLELLSTASSMLAKEPGELPVLASHLKGQEDSDRHQKRKGRSSKSSLSGTIQAGHHL